MTLVDSRPLLIESYIKARVCPDNGTALETGFVQVDGTIRAALIVDCPISHVAVQPRDGLVDVSSFISIHTAMDGHVAVHLQYLLKLWKHRITPHSLLCLVETYFW